MNTAVSSASSNIAYPCTKSWQVFTSEGHCSLLHNKMSKLIMIAYIYIFKYDSIPISIHEPRLGAESASGLLNVMQVSFLHDNKSR